MTESQTAGQLSPWMMGETALGSFPPFQPNTQPSLLEHLFSTLFLGCEAGNGPDFDLNPIVELFSPHVPDTLIGCGNGPVLGIGKGGIQVSLNSIRWEGEQKPLAIQPIHPQRPQRCCVALTLLTRPPYCKMGAGSTRPVTSVMSSFTLIPNSWM